MDLAKEIKEYEDCEINKIRLKNIIKDEVCKYYNTDPIYSHIKIASYIDFELKSIYTKDGIKIEYTNHPFYDLHYYDNFLVLVEKVAIVPDTIIVCMANIPKEDINKLKLILSI